MKEIWAIACNGFLGCRRFETEDEAKEAAKRLKAFSGQDWKVLKLTTF